MNFEAVEAAILSAMDVERRVRRRARLGASLACVAVFAGVVVFARASADRGDLLMAAGVVLLAAAALSTRSLLVIALACGASAAASWLRAETHGFGAHAGLDCLLTELGAALVPFVIVVAAALKNRDPIDVFAALQLACVGALCGQMAVALVCEGRHEAGHLWLFHTGGVVLSALVVTLAAAWRRRRQLRA